MTLKYIWDHQLSHKEVTLIGLITVQWAAMEHEVFSQTLASFEDEMALGGALPKEMNNIQFSSVLELWRDRVATNAKGRRAKVLLKQYDAVLQLKVYRDALVHGMWHWSGADLGSIFTTRVKKRDVITVKFTADDLSNFATQIGEINYLIRFPGGTVDLARARMRHCEHISRRALAVFTGAPVDDEGFPVANPGVPNVGSTRDA
jgi:hypothetical protein